MAFSFRPDLRMLYEQTWSLKIIRLPARTKSGSTTEAGEQAPLRETASTAF